MDKIFIVIVVIILTAGISLFLTELKERKMNLIQTFEECVRAGFAVEQSYPEVCKTSAGRRFVQKIEREKILLPADSEIPSTGVCASSPEEKIVLVTVDINAPSPRCQIVSANQSLNIKNGTSEKIKLWFGKNKNISFNVEPNKEYLYEPKFGDYLKPGVHALRGDPHQGPEIWLK